MDYVGDKIGQRFVEPPGFDLQACYADSRNVTPLIFVLSPGSAPPVEHGSSFSNDGLVRECVQITFVSYASARVLDLDSYRSRCVHRLVTILGRGQASSRASPRAGLDRRGIGSLQIL